MLTARLTSSYTRVVGNVDWSHRAEYMHHRHGTTATQANEALADPDAEVFDPDYASKSARSVRTIGWSATANRLLVVITLAEDGVVYGLNGWPANAVDTRHYKGEGPDE